MEIRPRPTEPVHLRLRGDLVARPGDLGMIRDFARAVLVALALLILAAEVENIDALNITIGVPQ